MGSPIGTLCNFAANFNVTHIKVTFYMQSFVLIVFAAQKPGRDSEGLDTIYMCIPDNHH